MSANPAWYLLGLLGAAIIASRVYASWRSASRSPKGAAHGRAAVLTAGVVLAALAPIVRLEPLAALFNTLLGPNAAWLVSDTLWLIAGTLGMAWTDTMRPEAIAPGTPALRRALLHPRGLLCLLVVAWLWLAPRLSPAAWAALEPGTVELRGDLLLTAARLAYAGYMGLFLFYFARALTRVRAVLASRAEYLRVSLALLAVAVYGASPVLQASGVLLSAFVPDLALWPALRVLIQLAQLTAGLLMLFVLGPPGAVFAVLERRVAVERAAALARLERFHAWLAARHAGAALPGVEALRGEARAAALLAEVERAARRALAAAPAGVRADFDELGEHGLFVAGRGTRGAARATQILAGALRAWDERPHSNRAQPPRSAAQGAPPLAALAGEGDLPRMHVLGEADAALIFWGRVAEQAVPPEAGA
jgi:hypothetical protein